MSLFRRCQRFQPLIANAYKPQFGSTSYIVQQTRNGGGGGVPGDGTGFSRSAWDLTPEPNPKKFPDAWVPNSNEPKFFLFIRPDLSGKTPPKETGVICLFLLTCWGYGLWYSSKWNPHGH